jgi:capsid protein
MNFKSLFDYFKPKAVGFSTSTVTTGTVDMGGYTFSIEYLMGLDPHALKLRALQTMWRSVVARGAMRQLNVLSVNTGLNLQSLPSRFALKVDSDTASRYAGDIEGLYSLVRTQKSCSFDNTMNLDELSILARWSWDIFGEYFAIVRYDGKGISPVNIQLINPLLVKTPSDVGKTANRTIKDGIEFRNKKPVAFWVEEKAVNSGSITWKRVPLVGPRSGMVTGIHGFDSQVPGEYRGTPKIAPVFHELERIQQALKYEIDSMATNAQVAMAIQRKEVVVNNEKIRAAISAGGDLRNSKPGQIDSTTVFNDKGGLVIQNGEKGEEFIAFDTKRPNVNMPEFVKQMIIIIGPAIGIASELWLMLFGKSYSASKGSIDLQWKNNDQENFKFSSGFNQPILEAIVGVAVAMGQIVLPGWSDPLKRAGYMVAKWLGIPKPSLNPLQEAKAASERISNYTSNRELESQMATGLSFEQNADRQTVEQTTIYDIDQLFAASDIDPAVDEL